MNKSILFLLMLTISISLAATVSSVPINACNSENTTAAGTLNAACTPSKLQSDNNVSEIHAYQNAGRYGGVNATSFNASIRKSVV